MNSIFLRRLLYTFKRDYGTVIDYVQVVSSTPNDDTGDIRVVRKVFTVPAVILPKQTVRKFVQDIGYLAADKNFTYGGMNDYEAVTFLVDRYDMPDDWDPALDGYINQCGRRYDRVSIDNMLDECYVIVAKGVVGANRFETIDLRACDRLGINDRAVTA